MPQLAMDILGPAEKRPTFSGCTYVFCGVSGSVGEKISHIIPILPNAGFSAVLPSSFRPSPHFHLLQRSQSSRVLCT